MKHIPRNINSALHTVFLCLAVAAIIVLLNVSASSAQQIIPPEPANTCTDGPQFKTDIPPGKTGVFTEVSQRVIGMTSSLNQAMFDKIQGDGEFQAAVASAIILYIAIYGMMFITGHVQANGQDFVIRCTKVFIVGVLASPNAWNFFSPYISDLLTAVTDEFMGQLISLTIGGSNVSGDSNFPMQLIDKAIAKTVSSNMGVHLLAMLFTPPYGFFYLILIGIALWSFLGLLLTGIWVYLTSIIFRGLLIGVAPLFIACFLFTRTKHLFDGWVNQLISTCLQPIMLFSFLAFFIMMVVGGPSGNGGLVDDILKEPVCWTGSNESLRGSPFTAHYWRFTIPSSVTDSGYEPYGGLWSWNGPKDVSGMPPFPIELMPLLTFLILAELGKRFGQVVLRIARELSASSVDIADMRNILAGLMPSSVSGGGAPVSGEAAAEAKSLQSPVQTFVKNMSEGVSTRK